ncbi:ROK family transcriptional regulator [Rhizobium sp. RAF56]|jgi:predicted NBD/HSP70 family sugar kinase|uniref:ROK family transcriptional regulator n=1 Tax=Rhizobium sp. RAF56 TaxID=3233062 RepID=UPI003F9D76A2
MDDVRPIRAKTGTNQEGASAHNRRVIMDALRVNRSLSRADLARATRLTKQTVSNIVEELEGDGLVVSLDAVRRGRGQPSTPYRLVAEGAFAIGLHIDRYLTRAVAVDLLGNVLVRAETSLSLGSPALGVKAILDLIEGVRRDLGTLHRQSEKRLVGLGVAMPGPFGLEAKDDDPWMMAAWQNFPLLETLAAGTGLEVGLQNDAAASATAERMVGAAHGLDHAVCLYLGYGIGAGLILNGELYSGSTGNAGEIGMVLSPPSSEQGERRPLEHRASLASLYQHMGMNAADPDLYQALAAASQNRDPMLMSWIGSAATDLRWSVQLIETIFDPESVILCGTAPEPLARLLIEAMHPLLPSIAEHRDRRAPRLQLGMSDPWASALGAAAEPISRTFDPRFSAILKTRDSA